LTVLDTDTITHAFLVGDLETSDVEQLNIADLTRLCHGIASNSGWWNEYNAGDATLRKHFVAGKIALVHSEVSEALEGFRKNLLDDHLSDRPMVEVEFADAIIRLLDLAGALNIDVGHSLARKLRYNAQRPDHKLENRAKAGGKSP